MYGHGYFGAGYFGPGFFGPSAGAATQDLTPALYSDNDAFFTHVLSSVRDLTPSLYADNDAFFTHVLSSTRDLTPSLFTDTETFFTHVINAGAATLLPSLYADADAFFTHTISTGAATLLPSLYTDPDVFFTQTMLAGATLHPDGDNVDGSWTNEVGSNVNLFASIDEVVASDTDYIRSSPNPSADKCSISLSNPGTAITTPMKLRYRIRKEGGVDQLDMTVRLLEGASIIAQFTHTNMSTSFIDVVQDIAPSPAIGDPNNLFIEFEANKP